MDDNNAGSLPFAQPQPDLGTLAQGQQQDEPGGGRSVVNPGPTPSGEHGSQAALSNPAGPAPLFGAGNANAQFEPFTGEVVQSVPALDFNGFVLHAAPKPVPEELQRDPSGASIAEPDSVFNEENGRTYHNYHEGRYYLPNDAAEQDRLDLQHKLWQVHMDDALFKAPIQLPPKNVLDVATGTGIWAIQMAKMYPDSNVIGTDLSLIQPEGPPNCSFIKEDAELDEWTLPVVFDYIHLRMIHTCFDDYRALFKKCYDNLEPGGWIELQDAVFKLMCTDGTADGSYIERFSHLILQAGESIGRDLDIPSKYKDMLTEAGFLDVVEDIGPVPGKSIHDLRDWPPSFLLSLFIL
ncbi:hypothetical protein SLS64_009302 [Diaporthe eres]